MELGEIGFEISRGRVVVLVHGVTASIAPTSAPLTRSARPVAVRYHSNATSGTVSHPKDPGPLRVTAPIPDPAPEICRLITCSMYTPKGAFVEVFINGIPPSYKKKKSV